MQGSVRILGEDELGVCTATLVVWVHMECKEMGNSMQDSPPIVVSADMRSLRYDTVSFCASR